MLNEISQSESDKCRMISLICRIYGTELTKEIDSWTESRLTAMGQGRLGAEGTEQKGKQTHGHGHQCGHGGGGG